MSDLIFYLEKNGFYPQTEDLEAILRRCDHDADRELSYEEFCELMDISPSDQDDD
jgi:Ca2+-binding EF-hand superfamily protein